MAADHHKGSPAGLLITFAASLAAAILLLGLFADSFVDALGLFFLSPFRNTYYFGNMLAASVPLMLGGLGISFAFSARSFNLGGEGQIYAGALGATVVCLALPDGQPFAVQCLAAITGAALGGAIGALSGLLKRALAVDELISSFLLSAAVVLAVDYAISGPLQDPSSNFQTTLAIAKPLRFARLLPPSSLSAGLILAVAACLIARFVVARTRFGFELRVIGQGGEFARYAGIDTGLYSVLPMALSGALHGLAGAAMIMGSYFKAMRGFSAGTGWSAIAVALIARNDPLAVLPSALFFAYLDAGAKSVMVGSSVTSEIVAVIQSVIFFLITARIGGRIGGQRSPGGHARGSGLRLPGGPARGKGLRLPGPKSGTAGQGRSPAVQEGQP